MSPPSLPQLQRVLHAGHRPLAMLWVVRLLVWLLVRMVGAVARVRRRAPTLVRLGARAARAGHTAAIATGATALAWASSADDGALWEELWTCAPARAPRANALVAMAALCFHFASLDVAPLTLSFLALNLVAEGSGLAFVLATSALINGSHIREAADAVSPLVLMLFYLLSLQLVEHVRDHCGPAHVKLTRGVGAVAYLEALRWGTLGMLRGWAELRKLM